MLGDPSAKGDRIESIDPVVIVSCCELMGDTSANRDRGETINPLVAILGVLLEMPVVASSSTLPALVGDTSVRGDRYKSFDPMEDVPCG